MGWGLRRGGKWRAGWMSAGLLCVGLYGLHPAWAMMNSVPDDPTSVVGGPVSFLGDPTGRFEPALAAGAPMSVMGDPVAVTAEGLSERRTPDEGHETPPEGHTWQIARALALSGDYEKAAALYASAYGQDPNPILYRQYLEVLLELERYKEAEALALRQMRSAAKSGGAGGGGREAGGKERVAGGVAGRAAGGHLPQTTARYRVDLGQIHLAQGQAAKAHKAFMQAVDDYWAQGGVGLAVDELSEALWRQSGTARYSAALYEAGRRAQSAVSIRPGALTDEAADCPPFAYELFKAYLHLGQMERMLEEALLFVRTQRDGCGGRFTPATTAAAPAATTAEGRYEAAMTQIEADWQAYFYEARQAAPATLAAAAAREAQPAPASAAPQAQPALREAQPASDAPVFRLKKALYAYWQKDPQNRDVAEWLWWAALQEGDYEQAFRMAEVFLHFAYDGGLKHLETARIAIRNQADREAAAALETLLRQAGEQPQAYLSEVVREARRDLLDLQFRRLEQGGLADSLELGRLKDDYEALWRQDPQAAADLGLWPVARNLARIYAYYTHEEEAAQTLMEQCIARSRVTVRQKAEMKTEYADMLLFMGKTWDAMLLYAQVEKDFKQDAVGFYAKLQTAKLSYYVGEFEWALSQLEVLRAATSKLIANDAMELSLLIKENNSPDSTYRGLRYVARADALAYRRLYGQALQVLDSVLRMPAEAQLHDDVHYKKAQIYMRMDSLEAALTALEHVYRQPAGQSASLWADDALLQAAACHEVLNRSEKAMEAYLELFERFPSSLLAPQAMESYRNLRQRVGHAPQAGFAPALSAEPAPASFAEPAPASSTEPAAVVPEATGRTSEPSRVPPIRKSKNI